MLVFLFLVFLSSVQPISMVMLLCLSTLWFSSKIYLEMGSFWFSFILILVVLSGILVVFMYMISLSSNQKFGGNFFFFFFFFLFVCEEFWMSESGILFECEKMWSGEMVILNVLILVFLLSVMMMVVWISGKEKGAIRVI